MSYPASATRLFLLLSASAIAAEPGSLISYSEVARKEVRLGDHKITLIRVRPPSLPKVAPATAAPPRPPTAEEKAYEERVATKGYATLQVSATVYFGRKTIVTELRWRNDAGDIEYRAYSNVDFRYLTELTQLETETTVYSWFPFLYECDLASWPKNEKSPLPPGLDFSANEAEYFVEAGAKALKSEETTLAGLDYLHAYYQLHFAELKAGYEKREKLAAAEEKARRKNPPTVPDSTLRWWPVTANSSTR